MYLLVVLVVMTVGVMGSESFACTPEFCWAVRCANPLPETCQDQEFREKGSVCGCCNVCVPYQTLGGKCGLSLNWGELEKNCMPGTVCKNNVCVYRNISCE